MKFILSHLAALSAGYLTLSMVALQARVQAYFAQGSMRLLGPLLLAAGLGALAGHFSSLLLLRRLKSLPRDEQSQQRHPSKTAEVAAEAARSSRFNPPFVWITLLIIASVGATLWALDAATHMSTTAGTRVKTLFLAAAGVSSFLVALASGLVELSRSGGWGSPHSRLLAFGLGSVLGLILTSRFAFKILGLNEHASLAVATGATLALLTLLAARTDRWVQPIAAAIVVLAAGRVATSLYARLDAAYERMTETPELQDDERFLQVIENEHGALTVTTSGWIFQNGRVQGIFNTTPVVPLDVNRCSRAYVIPSIIKQPRQILLLGLGSGSFAQILAHHDAVEKVTIVEDNGAYVRALRSSGVVASVAQNPKVEIIDDVPFSHPRGDGNYDVILLDRLPYRRGDTSRYLTKEYFERLDAHVRDGGTVIINTASQENVERTMLEVFPYLLRYQDMVFGSRERLRIDGYHWMRQLRSWEIDGRHVIRTRGDPTEVARRIVKNRDFRGEWAWERQDSIRSGTKKAEVLTLKEVTPPLWEEVLLPQ